MLKIRLTRRGKRNKAFFRLVVAEHTSPIKGKFIEVLGFLNPHTKEKSLKEDRIKYWLDKGAQCSDSAHNFLVGAGIIDGPKRAIKIKEKAVEEQKEETKPGEPAPKATPNEAGEEKKEEPAKEEVPVVEKSDDKNEKKEEISDKKEEKADEPKAKESKVEEPEKENKEPSSPASKEEKPA